MRNEIDNLREITNCDFTERIYVTADCVFRSYGVGVMENNPVHCAPGGMAQGTWV